MKESGKWMDWTYHALRGKGPEFIISLIREGGAFGPAPTAPTREYPDMPGATVGLAGTEKSIEKAVREAVEAAGGLKEIEKGQKVVIKPNMVAPSEGYGNDKPVTTNPEVIRAVIRLVKERGAHAIVGDRATFMDETAMVKCGFAKVCEEEGAEAYPWLRGKYVRFFPEKRHWKKGFRYPKILADADHFINVPMLKNHELTLAEITCCMKSYVGVLHPADRWQWGENALHTKNIGEKIAEVNLCKKPTINIVDATTIMVKGGPAGHTVGSKWVQSNLILASKDTVACDSAALAVLKLHGAENNVKNPYVTKSVWDNVQIYYGGEIGVGQADPNKIGLEDVKVPGFSEIKDNWV